MFVVLQPFKFNHDAFGLSVLTIKGCVEEPREGGKENSVAAGGGGGLEEFKRKVQNVGSPAVKPARMTNTLQVQDRTGELDVQQLSDLLPTTGSDFKIINKGLGLISGVGADC